jgi:glycine/serine hydroxymethyltransferase
VIKSKIEVIKKDISKKGFKILDGVTPNDKITINSEFSESFARDKAEVIKNVSGRVKNMICGKDKKYRYKNSNISILSRAVTFDNFNKKTIEAIIKSIKNSVIKDTKKLEIRYLFNLLIKNSP